MGARKLTYFSEEKALEVNAVFLCGVLEKNPPLAKNRIKSYPYGFNGQERVDEVSGSGAHTTAPFWEYDTRAVHRWNLDPRPVTSISPYAIMQGNPIWYSDPLGDTIRINYTAGENKQLQTMTYTPGMEYEGDNKFLSQTINDLNTTNSKEKGGEMINHLSSISEDVTIMQASRGNTTDGFKVGFDISSIQGGLNENGERARPSFVGLSHELAHVWDKSLGSLDKSTWYSTATRDVPNAEKFATHIENQIRAEHNLPLRTHYGLSSKSRIIDGEGRSLFYRTTTKIKLMNPDGGLFDDGLNRTILEGIDSRPFKY
jgi:hypothetical protein